MKKYFSFIIFLLIFSSSYSQCGQYIQNKLSALTDVRFWDENNGFVIGGSSLLTTHDGGDSWRSYELPHYETLGYRPLNDVEIIDSDKAIIVGDSGIILYTENKGVDWVNGAGIEGLEGFRAVSFFDKDTGYVVGGDFSGEDRPFLYKTTDGGKNWSRVYSNISSMGSFLPEGLLFLDKNIGYVWGSAKIYKTMDGGKTWLEINNPSNSHILKLQFVDSQTAYLNSFGGIYKSTDGGSSWTLTDYLTYGTTGTFTVNNNFLYYSNLIGMGVKKVSINGGSIETAFINQAGYATDIYFVNDNVGFIVGRKGAGSPSMGRFIYKTIDGGLNWTQLDGGSPKEDIATYFKKINENEYIYSMVSGGNYKHSTILISRDKGASWKTLYETEDVMGYTLFAEGDYISHRRSASPYSSAEFIIAESYDKGITWVDGPILRTEDTPSGYLGFLTQVSLNDLFIRDFGTLHHSPDKGVTWNLISTPSDIYITQVQYIDENNFSIYGNTPNLEPIVYKTHNSGVTWDFVAHLAGQITSQTDIFDYSTPNKIYFYPRHPGEKLFIYDIPNQNLIERDVPFNIINIKAINDDSFMIMDNSVFRDIFISHDVGITWHQRFWKTNGVPAKIYIENEGAIFIWGSDFIQELKLNIPADIQQIFGNDNAIINKTETYIIPVDLFSIPEWELESGGRLILNDNTFFYKARVVWEEEGEHTLKVRRINGCGETVFTEIKVAVGFEEIRDSYDLEKISVYPNPFDENLKIYLPKKYENSRLTISLTNILGQPVYNQDYYYSPEPIEINNIPKSISSGIYFIKIKSLKYQESKKLVKK